MKKKLLIAGLMGLVAGCTTHLVVGYNREDGNTSHQNVAKSQDVSGSTNTAALATDDARSKEKK